MIKSLNNKAHLESPLEASFPCYITLVIFGITSSFLYKWVLLCCFSIDATNYYSINDIAAPLVIVTLWIALVGIFNFFSFPFFQELKEKYNYHCDTAFTAIFALFFVILGIYVNDKSYIVLGILSLVALILIVLYTKNALKLLLVACSFTYMVISSAIIKANNIKDIHHTKDLVQIFLTQQSNLKLITPIKLITLNDRYCLFYDINNKEVISVRAENIGYIVKDIKNS